MRKNERKSSTEISGDKMNYRQRSEGGAAVGVVVDPMTNNHSIHDLMEKNTNVRIKKKKKIGEKKLA